MVQIEHDSRGDIAALRDDHFTLRRLHESAENSDQEWELIVGEEAFRIAGRGHYGYGADVEVVSA